MAWSSVRLQETSICRVKTVPLGWCKAAARIIRVHSMVVGIRIACRAAPPHWCIGPCHVQQLCPLYSERELLPNFDRRCRRRRGHDREQHGFPSKQAKQVVQGCAISEVEVAQSTSTKTNQFVDEPGCAQRASGNRLALTASSYPSCKSITLLGAAEQVSTRDSRHDPRRTVYLMDQFPCCPE